MTYKLSECESDLTVQTAFYCSFFGGRGQRKRLVLYKASVAFFEIQKLQGYPWTSFEQPECQTRTPKK